jgi:hypothetical protein
LIRAVRARRAALTAGLTGFAAFLLAGFVDFSAAAACFFAVCVTLCALETAAPDRVELLDDCPSTGSTIISVESKTARLLEASRETKVREDATFISLL